MRQFMMQGDATVSHYQPKMVFCRSRQHSFV